MEGGTAGFMLGVNVPWVRYGDFGANAWHPAGGLAAWADLDWLAGRLQHARAAGATAARWFLLCDGRAGLRCDDDGRPLGLTDDFWRDVDTALRLADVAGLRLVPVLFDYLWFSRRRVRRGVQLGGRAALILDADSRSALLDRVVDPVLGRYGAEPGILAWDVFNEPEWATVGVGTWRPWRSLSRASMRNWLRLLTGRVHALTRHPATVGSASARWLDLVRGIGLDVYQPHWYEHLDARAPLDMPVSAMALDRPVWLGEFPTRAGRRSVEDVCEAARRSGYAGAFAWSLLANDAASRFTEAAPQLARWTAATNHRAGSMPDATLVHEIPGTALPVGASERQERRT